MQLQFKNLNNFFIILMLCLSCSSNSETVDEKDQSRVASTDNSTRNSSSINNKKAKAVKAGKRKLSKDVPFKIELLRSYFTGNCSDVSGSSKKENISGIKGVADLRVTYTGDDIIFKTAVKGKMVLKINDHRNKDVQVDMLNSGVSEDVSGNSPWKSLKKRTVHFESEVLNEAFCYAKPEFVKLKVELEFEGVNKGVNRVAIYEAPVNWQSVKGFCSNTELKLLNKKSNVPVKVKFSWFDKLLATKLDGTTRWFNKNEFIISSPLNQTSCVTFPVTANSGAVKITIKSISTVLEYDKITLNNEADAIYLFSTEIINSSGEDVKIGKMKILAEVSPDTWAAPVKADMGQIGTHDILEAGSSITGNLAYKSSRFLSPFRLHVIMDNGDFYLNVFK